MCVVGHVGAAAVAELLQPGHVLRQVVGRHGSVFNKGDRLVVAADAHHQPEADLAHGPNVFLLRSPAHLHDNAGGDALAAQVTLQSVDFRLQLRFSIAVELGDEDAVRPAFDEGLQQARVFGHVAAKRKAEIVQQFDG